MKVIPPRRRDPASSLEAISDVDGRKDRPILSLEGLAPEHRVAGAERVTQAEPWRGVEASADLQSISRVHTNPGLVGPRGQVGSHQPHRDPGEAAVDADESARPI